MNRILAYADEYGTNSFKFELGSHFIVASVIVQNNNLASNEDAIEKIRKKHFQTGEIKSSKIAKNSKRRIKVLTEVVEKVDFSIFALVVDKRKLYGEGFKYKRPFYKYLNGLLYKELYKSIPNLYLEVDEHGGNDFLIGFKKYVQKNYIRDLFSQSELEIGKSHQNLHIQIADLIAGTLARCFDDTMFESKANTTKYLELIKPKLSSISHFPAEYTIENYIEEESDETYDSEISHLAVSLALDFIETADPKKQTEYDQINFLKLLLLFRRANSHKKFITTNELLRHLNTNREKPMSIQYFRSRIIGKLRDKGILIASSSSGERRGYKLPTSINDLDKFLKHGRSILIPMVRRIKRCQERIKLATNNKLDILDRAEFKQLKKIIE